MRLRFVAHRDAVEVGEVAEVVERRQAIVEAAVAAEHMPDPPADLAGIGCRIDAQHASRPRCGEQQRREDLDRRRLAGAVWSEQSEELAALDLEADPVQRVHLGAPAPEDARAGAVGAAELLDLDRRHGPRD
jgi:hypothetical protein